MSKLTNAEMVTELNTAIKEVAEQKSYVIDLVAKNNKLIIDNGDLVAKNTDQEAVINAAAEREDNLLEGQEELLGHEEENKELGKEILNLKAKVITKTLLADAIAADRDSLRVKVDDQARQITDLESSLDSGMIIECSLTWAVKSIRADGIRKKAEINTLRQRIRDLEAEKKEACDD